MEFRFSAVLITVLASNLLIILICMILFSKKLLADIGYKILGIFLILTVLRFLFPFELPITTNIYFPKYLSILISGLCRHRVSFAGIRLSIWNFAEVVWGIGILWNLRKYIQEYQMVKQVIYRGTDLTDHYQQLLTQICGEAGKANLFRIIELSGIETPMVCRVKTPYILIPAYSSYTDKELYYILKHETAHFFHHDFLVKAGVRLLCILYWWNPFIYILKKQSDTVLEMRVDHTLTQNNNQTKADYLSCLIDLAKRCQDASQNSSDFFIPFCSHSCLSDRFSLLLNARSDRRRRLPVILPLSLVIAAVYLGSLFYIFEVGPYTMPTELERTVFILTGENTYAIDNGNGTFDIYFEDERWETVDSLQYYPPDMKIYKKGTQP